MTNYRRGYNFERVLYVSAPTGGWNPDVNPWEVPNDQAPILDNFIVRPGKIAMRGQIPIWFNASQLTLSLFKYAGGLIVQTNNPLANPSGALIFGARADGAGRTENPFAPLVNASAASLAQADANLYGIVIDTSITNSFFFVTRDEIPGQRWINFDGLMYGIGFDATAAAVHDTNSNYFVRPTSLLTYPAGGVNLANPIPRPTILANAPHGAFDLKGYLQRIWLLAGVDTPGGLTVHEPATLYYTIPGTSSPAIGTASADWRDPVAGTTQKLKMDNNNADFGVGLGVTRNAMVVFRRSSVWVLRGTTSATFQLQPISKEVGCLDARSIVETDHGIYFISRRGLMLTDGITVRDVSGNISQALRNAISNITLGLTKFNRPSWIQCTALSEGHILVGMGSWNSGITTTWYESGTFTALFDPSTGAWSRITSNFWWEPRIGPPPTGTQPWFAGPLLTEPTRGQTYAMGNTSLTAIENLTFDNFATILKIDANGSAGGYDLDVSGAGIGNQPINAAWATRVIPLTASEHRNAQAKRWWLDYIFGGSTSSFVGWNVSVRSPSQGTPALAADTPITRTDFNSGKPLISHAGASLPAEVVPDMYFIVSFSTSFAGSNVAQIAEIYGIGLEYQLTSDAT